jgi:hypothetical protein
MMLQFQGVSRHCNLLAVLSGKSHDSKQKQKQKQDDVSEGQFSSYPFPELSSSGRLEVTTVFSFVYIYLFDFVGFWKISIWSEILTFDLISG